MRKWLSMRICSGVALATFSALLALALGPAQAADSAKTVAAPPSAGMFSSAIAAYRQGISAFRSGAVKASLPALKFAADQGVLGAQLQLAEIYASGRDVPRDSAKAYDYYRQIADDYADIASSSPVAKYVSEAFVALGHYQLDGIPSAGLRPNPERAADLFRHAASYFGDPDAQYQLAQLYLEGKGVDKDIRLGVNWLAMAARKQNAESEAMLGKMLWRGEKVEPRYVRGLALIALAHYNASKSGHEPAWIKALYVKAFTGLDDRTRKQAEALIPAWGGPKLALAPLPPRTPEVTAKAAPSTKIPLPSGGHPKEHPQVEKAVSQSAPEPHAKPGLFGKMLMPATQQAAVPSASDDHPAAVPVSEESNTSAPIGSSLSSASASSAISTGMSSAAAAPSPGGMSAQEPMGLSAGFSNGPAGTGMHP